MATVTTSKKIQAAQVYFPFPLYIQIKQIASDEGKPMATWVRDVVTAEVEKKEPKKKAWADLPTFDWPEKDRDLSKHVDDVIYAHP